MIFANTRAFAEKLTHDLRCIYSKTTPSTAPPAEHPSAPPAPTSVPCPPSSVLQPPSSVLRPPSSNSVAAHHSALDAIRRREIERALRAGELRAVVTSTSLELGVDIGTADVTVQVGLPGGVARCVQRVGRSGHRRGAGSRGLLLAATPAELAGAIITARRRPRRPG